MLRRMPPTFTFGVHQNQDMRLDLPTRTRRLGLDLAYLSLGIVSGSAALALWITGVTVSLSLAIFVIIGLPIVLATLACFRWFAGLERQRAELVLGAPIRERYRRPTGGSQFAHLRVRLADPATWKDLAWLVLLFPVGLGAGTIALTWWGWVLGSLTLPAWYWALPDDADVGGWDSLNIVTSTETAFIAIPVGLLAIIPGWWITRWLAQGSAELSRWLLAPSRAEALEERVEVLTTTRAGAVDAAAGELERIERDLHDGAQARLVAMAMNLGMAEGKLDDDPETARELMSEARAEAQRALAELRDLARGIHPPLLADRGLTAAITELAARNPVPTRAEVDVPSRLPRPIEAAAYFVVAEALTNAVKHSGALHVLVRVGAVDDRLRIEVRDDGAGGADPRGHGLTGLARRVAALDGHLEIDSPPGVGTALRAEVPCGS
jgi:signal transduction histidine kinase